MNHTQPSSTASRDVAPRSEAYPISRPCPSCGGESRHPQLKARDPLSSDTFCVVRCRDCGLSYVDPRPEGEHLASYYAADYYGGRHPALKGLLMGLRARHLGPAGARRRLLDVGCGGGDFILACRRRGWEVAGVEQDQAPAMQLRDTLGIQVVTPDAMSTLHTHSFDVVTFWHVLEHLPDPRGTLGEVRRVLRPDGRLIIEVPNLASWQARFGGAEWYHLDLPRHLLHFDRTTLDTLLRGARFATERWHTFSLEYDAFGLAQTVLNKVCKNPNHLFQMLIGKPTGSDVRDTLLSLGLMAPVGAAALAVSLLAPLFASGGVLRVVARPMP